MLWSHKIEFITSLGYKRIYNPRAPWITDPVEAANRMTRDFDECQKNESIYRPTRVELVARDETVELSGKIWTTEDGNIMLGDRNLTALTNDIAEEYDELNVKITLTVQSELEE